MGRIGSGSGERFLFVDALRGAAALMVFGYHLTPLLDGVPKSVLSYGWSGVQAFFVVSGFVIAHSIRDATPTAGFIGNFILRRSIRLDPPYWCVLALVLILNQVSNLVRGEQSIPFPGWGAVAAHLVYLQNILGYGDIVDVFWSLCFEMQMYLAFIIGLGLCRRLTWAETNGKGPTLAALLLFFGLAALSLAHQLGWLALPEKRWFINDWYEFFLGALAYWATSGRCRARWFYALAAAVALVVVWSFGGNVGAIVSLATALLLFVASRRGWLTSHGILPGLPYLGKLSYSFYLVHNIILARLTRVADRFGTSRSLAVPGIILLGGLASLLAAYLLFRLVETPCVRLSKRFKKPSVAGTA